ncbi:MAG: hypothetical protein JXB29_02405 [Sedimentisphaerales bacterium]|nr:hypothetical protein [Sedimentisphaerales bacterium]
MLIWNTAEAQISWTIAFEFGGGMSNHSDVPTVNNFTVAGTATVEYMPAVSAVQFKDGLGFNVNPRNRWELEMAKNAGATEVRFQASWERVEDMDGVYSMMRTIDYNSALNWCVELGLQPLIIAAYAGPRENIGTFTVAATVPGGSTNISLLESVGYINPPYCHILKSDGSQIVPTGKWGYYGALIHSVDNQNNSINLAASTNVTLPAGTKLIVNRLRYDSCPTCDPCNSSIQAYGNYAKYIASEIANKSLTGRVELWNEPPWAHDPWDNRRSFYDVAPVELTSKSPNPGFAQNLKSASLPPNVRFN